MFLPDFLKKQPTLEPEAEIIEYNLPEGVEPKHSARAKRLAIRLDTKARVFYLVIPKRTGKKRAEAFAWQHARWMKERLAELPEKVKFVDGLSFSLLGETVTIQADFNDAYKRTDIRLEGDVLHVRTNKTDPHNRIVRFLKKLAKDELEGLARQKAEVQNLDIQKVTIRDTKTRWGSCSTDANLSFSWRLILAPYEAIDYVVAHEVAHLVHMDHSPDFWAVCEKLSEDYAQGKQWMRAHAHELMKY